MFKYNFNKRKFKPLLVAIPKCLSSLVTLEILMLSAKEAIGHRTSWKEGLGMTVSYYTSLQLDNSRWEGTI